MYKFLYFIPVSIFLQGDERLDFRSSYDDTEKSKFISKAKENPFVPAGEFCRNA